MAHQRYRERFNFWLDVRKDTDLLLAENIDRLKARRQFVGAIRDGLELIIDLRAGRVDALKRLFPWVFDAVASHFDAERDAQQAQIERQLERLEELLLEQGSHPNAQPALPSGPKPLATPQIAAPIFDDDDDIDLEITERSGNDAARNLVSSMNALHNR